MKRQDGEDDDDGGGCVRVDNDGEVTSCCWSCDVGGADVIEIEGIERCCR